MALVKKTCPRCNGTGHFSFHLVRGTVCFMCNGSKFVMVDDKKEERKRRAREASEAVRRENADMMRTLYNEVVKEMNAKYGPFDISTPLGIDRLNSATANATGKALHVIRDERFRATRESLS